MQGRYDSHGYSNAVNTVQCPCARLVTLHSNSCPVARYNNLPEEIRERHVKDKSNAAYILGWSERSVSGRATSTSASCFNTPHIQSYTMHTALNSTLQLILHSVCNGSTYTATQHMPHGCRFDAYTVAHSRTYTHPWHCTHAHPACSWATTTPEWRGCGHLKKSVLASSVHPVCVYVHSAFCSCLRFAHVTARKIEPAGITVLKHIA